MDHMTTTDRQTSSSIEFDHGRPDNKAAVVAPTSPPLKDVGRTAVNPVLVPPAIHAITLPPSKLKVDALADTEYLNRCAPHINQRLSLSEVR
jgi:hypothetical protein